MSEAYPIFEVVERKTDRAVCVIVWNVRAIYEAEADGETVTRIEYTNGNVLDARMDVSFVVGLFRHAATARDARHF